MRSELAYIAFLLAAVAGHLERASADVQRDNDGNVSLSQPETEDSGGSHKEELLVPYIAAAVVAVVGLLAAMGVVVAIRYGRNTGRLTTRSIINQRQLGESQQLQVNKKILEQPPLIPPRTPNMHSLANTDSSSSSASTRSTTVSDHLDPQNSSGVDCTTGGGNCAIHFEFPTSSSTDLDAISCSSEPPPLPPWTLAASVLTLEESGLEAEMSTGTASEQMERGLQEPVPGSLLPPRNIPRLKLTATLSAPPGCVEDHLEPTIVVNRNPAYRVHSLN